MSSIGAGQGNTPEEGRGETEVERKRETLREIKQVGGGVGGRQRENSKQGSVRGCHASAGGEEERCRIDEY